ncbi:hypothetical protein [Limosilactobacillus reuteri]|uniref:hypothetical protein n=1 Tax=Limosilactobacillus reuteri TaxID=1598 RepID=UPI00081BF32F|nr:hypothetical protein [Limosilactobacillus reuteri]MCH5379000.1 MSCRAMM family adhesin SdrC [Limosilactobacillus reuteri]OCW67508.1 hypothetical protein BBP13_09085 [Limosilactobacillus reuteri]OCW69837.1 hypothetical protein BBP14_02375 [Limosilactobacillus reuteri]
MINVTTVKLPTHFEKTEELDNDSRFQKVKIYIAHTGENLNNSVFSYDVLENMIPSLANIPILGYVGVNEDNEEDFRGHEKRLTLKDDKFKLSFATHAYGFIPEDNNAHFETTGGKEWLVTNGYLWTRFVDAMELFQDANGSKGQSMEVGDAEGYTDDRGRMVFTNARFTGLCILGDDVPPAMAGSTISTIFSKEDFKSTFEEMLAEFSAEKGENSLATKKKQDDEPIVVTSNSSTASDEEKSATPTSSANTSSASKPAEPAKAEDDKAKASPASTDSSTSDKTSTNESSAEPATEEQADSNDDSAQMSSAKDESDTISSNENESDFKKEDEDDDSEEKDNAEDDDQEDKKNKAQFELSLSDKELSFLRQVRTQYGGIDSYTSIAAVFDNYGIVRVSGYELNDSHYFSIPYTVNADDSIKLGDKTEVFPTYLTESEKTEVENNRAKVKNLQAQLAELKAFKSGIEMQAKEESLKNAEDDLTADQIKEIKAQFEAKTPEEIEKEIAFALYTTHKKEMTTSPTSSRGGVKAVNLNAKRDYGYGSANALFHK